jgi:hypothetical protein
LFNVGKGANRARGMEPSKRNCCDPTRTLPAVQLREGRAR